MERTVYDIILWPSIALSSIYIHIRALDLRKFPLWTVTGYKKPPASHPIQPISCYVTSRGGLSLPRRMCCTLSNSNGFVVMSHRFQIQPMLLLFSKPQFHIRILATSTMYLNVSYDKSDMLSSTTLNIFHDNELTRRLKPLKLKFWWVPFTKIKILHHDFNVVFLTTKKNWY